MNKTINANSKLRLYTTVVKTVILSIFLLLFLKQTSPVKAQQVVFEDDFSNGFEKWESVRDHLDLWSTTDGKADIYIDTGSTWAELVPKDEYWSSDWKNIIYELDYSYIAGADANISFGFQDLKNWYEIHFANGDYQLVRVKNGKVVWGKNGHANVGSNHLTVIFNQGQITFKINDNILVDAQDTTFEDNYGKISIKATTGSIYPTHVAFDNIVVKSLDNLETKLSVPIQKQTDSNWASQEYDSANNWSSSIGIDRWGCALTSASMILNYHNINTMPNGDEVNPNTLNSWLNSQEDGYIGSGLVNWIAITRLTKNINEVFNTPKLEYSRTQGDNLYTAKTELEDNKPSILQIAGHFLVASGVVNGSQWSEEEANPENDLYINDPAFEYEKFSQHQTPLLSTRTFQPSFTDLSYIHLSYSPLLTLNMINEDNSNIPLLQNFNDYLTEFNVDDEENFTPQTSPTIQISELAKPTQGTYFIHLQQDELSTANTTIFAYDQAGELSNLSFSGLVGQAGITLKLEYNPQGESQLIKIINFQTFLNDLSELLSRKEIRKHYVYQELYHLASFAKDDETGSKSRYIDALNKTIDFYSEYLSTNAFHLLHQRLEEIK